MRRVGQGELGNKDSFGGAGCAPTGTLSEGVVLQEKHLEKLTCVS